MACYNPNNLSPDELSCPICFEEFACHSSSDRSPKLLLCLHTFCLGCIRNLVKSNKTIQCSICRTEHKDVTPLELFDNHVIVEFIRKQQEESDAQLARQHSLADGSSFTVDYQQRQHQVEQDAEFARKIQSLYDEDPNIEPMMLENESMCVSYPAAPPRQEAVKAAPPCQEVVNVKVAPHLPSQIVTLFGDSSAPAFATASTSQAGTYCHSSAVPHTQQSRSVTPDTSASSSTTPSSSTTSSNGTTSTTSSDSTSSDDRCSSQASASSQLDDEFVDSVDIIDATDDRIAPEVAGTAEANMSGSTAPLVLTPTLTNNSSFVSDTPIEALRPDMDNGDDDGDDDEDDDNDVISEDCTSDLEDEDGGEDTAYVVLEPRNDSDVFSNMDALENLDENSIVDDDRQECITVSEGGVAPQVEEADGGHLATQQEEDELFDNFNALESRCVNRVEESDFSGITHISGSSESDDSSADVPPVVDIADEMSLDSVLSRVNDPDDDDTGSTITINDTVESESDNVVLLNEYNGVLTRNAAAKLRKSNPDLSL